MFKGGNQSKLLAVLSSLNLFKEVQFSWLRLNQIRLSQTLQSRNKFNWKVRERFYQHLADQVGNDIALETALNNFRARMIRAKKKASAQLILLITQKLKNGLSFSQSLDGLVSNEELAMITAGEMAGNLPHSLNLILEQRARTTRLKKTLIKGLSAPMFQLLVVCGVLWFIASSVIPQLESVVSMKKAHGLVYALFVLSGFVNSLWVLLIPIIFILAIVGLAWSFPRWTGRIRVTAEHYFPYSYYRDLMGYQWLMVFTALLQAGIPDVNILQMQAKNASPYLKERLTLFYQRLRSGGMSLAQAITAPVRHNGTPLNFPNPEINESIIALYGFANFPERITKLVGQWADQMETQTLELARSLGFFLDVLMFVVMSLLAVAINDLSSQVGNIPM